MRPRFWLGLALAAAIAVSSLIVARAVSEQENDAFERGQRQHALRAAHQTEALAALSLGQLSSAAAFFKAEGDFSQRQFEIMANSLLRTGGISGAAFIELVERSERGRFERERGFRITERAPLGYFRPAAPDSSYHPISYAATKIELGVRFPLGYDLGEDPGRDHHLRRARDTGSASATEMIRLSLGGPGVNVFRPVYRDRAPIATVRQRRAALIGFAAGAFRLEDLMLAATDALPDEFETQLVEAGETISGSEIPREEAAAAPIRIADQTWLLVVRDPDRPTLTLAAMMVVLGISLASLLGALVLIWSRRERMHALALQASQDPLTGLKNRRRFEEDLRTELARARRERSEGAVMMLDVDEFKRVNDTHGHPAGDRVIRQIADALRRRTRETDVVARMGGDEFAIVLPRCSAAEAGRVADSIADALHDLLPPGDAVSPISVSVGIAMYGEEAVTDFESVQAGADAAMYEAKAAGRAAVRGAVEPLESS